MLNIKLIQYLQPTQKYENKIFDNFSDSEENDDVTTLSSLSDVDETMQNWRKRGYVRKRIKGVRKVATEASGKAD